MLDLTLLPAYLAAVAIITVVPGPDAAYIVAVALERGPRAGLVSAAGMALGMLVHVTAAALGLAVMLRSTPAVLVLVELVGGCYIGCLAVTTIRSAGKAPPAIPAAPAARRVLRRAVLTNLLNPKTVLFFAAFLPRFTNAQQGPLWLQLLTLGMIFLLMGLAWDSAIGLCAGRLGQGLVRGRRATVAVSLIAGATMAALAVILLKDALTALVS
ncbi:LysE family translocator [Streptomyces sp. NPDC032198]|uniref:LysE family translocator n=1 Tax=Streptomyces sp. NPDC032198 TaxID=3155127 RepID=UPI0033FCEF27